MVRRWSYINSLNTRSKFVTTSWLLTYSQETAKDTIYLRHKLLSLTFNLRTKVSRRKHLNQWLFYTPVLADWSSEYIVLKQYTRSIFNLHSFKFNYLAINLMLSTNQHNRSLNSLNVLLKSSLTKRWLLYFNKKYSTFKFLVNHLKNTNIVLLSSPHHLEEKNLVPTKTGITHLAVLNSLYSTNYQPTLYNNSYSLLTHSINLRVMQFLKEYYKIMTLLVYYQLNNFVFKKNTDNI